MPLNFLDKSPELGSLLVRLHDKHSLSKVSVNPDFSLEDELAVLIQDLVSFDLSINEQELINDVLMSLIQKMERDIKRSVADRLSTLDVVPLRILLHLANDDISVAEPILRDSNAFDAQDLLYIVKSQPVSHARVIATRPSLNDTLVNALADINDVVTSFNLLDNGNIRLTPYAIGFISDLADVSENLVVPLIKRSEVSKKIILRLYQSVGKAVQQEILNYCDIDDAMTSVVEEVIDAVTLDFETKAYQFNDVEYTALSTKAEQLLLNNQLSPEHIIEALRHGRINKFLAMLSIYSGLTKVTIEQLLQQKNGQGLSVVCKALGIVKADFVNMFLLSSRIRGGGVVGNKDLSKALKYFDRMTEAQAKSILNKSRQ